jgi:lipoyl(octanoyl) transferase
MIEWITLPNFSSYLETLHLMENKVEQAIKTGSETIYLVEHEDVYTAGTNFKAEELLNPGDIPVIYTGRGGKFTYHGKGQRVIYPILNLAKENRQKDLKLYISMLEKWIINTLLHIGVRAYTIPGKVGIWVNDQGENAKIGAIGVRIKKWVTYHGISVNISTELNKFNGIIACGLDNFKVTSLEKFGIKINFCQFDKILKTEFERVF